MQITPPHTPKIDPVDFAAALIRRPSVTGTDAGALDTLQSQLEALGFVCTRYPFGEALRKTAQKSYCPPLPPTAKLLTIALSGSRLTLTIWAR